MRAHTLAATPRIYTIMKNFETFDSPDQRMSTLLSSCRDIIERHAQAMGMPVSDLNDAAQEELISKLNPRIAFELGYSGLEGSKVTISGTGLMIVSDIEGAVEGAEVVSDGDIVQGILDTVCALPVPTLSSVLSNNESNGASMQDRSLDALLVLKRVTYKTGLGEDGVFQAEHQLGIEHQSGLPILYHRLQILSVELPDQAKLQSAL